MSTTENIEQNTEQNSLQNTNQDTNQVLEDTSDNATIEELIGQSERIQIPSITNTVEVDDTNKQRMMQGISGKKVRELVLPQDSVFITPSYLVDLSQVQGAIDQMSVETITSLIAKTNLDDLTEEERKEYIAVYIKAPKGGIGLIGYGECHRLYSVLKKICELQYKGSVIWLNKGDGYAPVTDEEIFGFRLHL